jgi:hypothetical protein
MKRHFLIALLPPSSTFATLLPMPFDCRGYAHPYGTIVGGFCTESASGKTQEEARANAENRAYSKYRGSNFRITHVSFSTNSFGYIFHIDLKSHN